MMRSGQETGIRCREDERRSGGEEGRRVAPKTGNLSENDEVVATVV